MKAMHTIFLKFSFLLLLSFSLISCSGISGGSAVPGDGTGYNSGFDSNGLNGLNGANGGRLSDQDLALSGADYGSGNIPEAQSGGAFDDIFFGYDSTSISPEYQAQLQLNAQVMINDPSLRVEIEGHCDSRGTNEYNLALGEERARSVAAMLVNFGADANQISTISYGEEIPLDPSENDAAYSRNRRVHFALSRPN